MAENERGDALMKALVAALNEMPEVGTDKQADLGKYRIDYLRLPTLLKIVKPVLAKHGLAVMQMFEGDRLKTVIVHEGGATMTSAGAPVPANADLKKWGAGASYARRYALCAALGLAPDPDVDGDALPGAVEDAPPEAAVRASIERGFDALELSAQQRAALLEQHQNDPDGLLERLREMFRRRGASAGIPADPERHGDVDDCDLAPAAPPGQE